MAHLSPTTINASGGIDNFFVYLTNVTDWWFGRMIMVAIWVIITMGYLKKNDEDYIGAFAVSSYVTFILGLFFWVMKLLHPLDLGLLLGISAVSTIALLLQKKDM